jgi:hypothetical protein
MSLILRLSKNKAGHVSGPVVLISIVWKKTLSANGIDLQVCLYRTDYTAEKKSGQLAWHDAIHRRRQLEQPLDIPGGDI